MDNIGKVKLNDVIVSNINLELSIFNLCSMYDRDKSLEIIKILANATRDSLIEEIVSEESDAVLRMRDEDPKDIANEIAIQANNVLNGMYQMINDTFNANEEEDEEEDEED